MIILQQQIFISSSLLTGESVYTQRKNVTYPKVPVARCLICLKSLICGFVTGGLEAERVWKQTREN